uniref:BOS complex subunit TMEM147 n=1 Tax=Phallusia mammillata TaxID=59560 RepID=A0A6F9DVJ9_9ASCI|nr:transmembrane protein 147-like [Phallusia mammillata]
MTFVHFVNCMALAYAPYVVTYKSSILSEYSALMKVLFAGMVYMLTQLAKMLTLATFFPTLEPTSSGAINIVGEVLKTTVDMADLVGIYFIINRTVGKPELKVLIAGVGWAGAQVLFSNFLSFWFGARGLEFDWKYIQMALDANITLVHIIATAALVWTWTRNDLNRTLLPMVTVMLVFSVFRTIIADIIVQLFSLNPWSYLLLKAIMTFVTAALSLQLYVGFTDM